MLLLTHRRALLPPSLLLLCVLLLLCTVVVDAQPVDVTVNCGTGQTAGMAFNCVVSATGGTAPYTGTGTFPVTQPVKGTFTETFSVHDTNSPTLVAGSQSVTVTGQPVVVTLNCGTGQT